MHSNHEHISLASLNKLINRSDELFFFLCSTRHCSLPRPSFAYFLDGFFFVRAYLTRTANYALNSSNCEKCCDAVRFQLSMAW